jgi:hypothetical protein
MFDLASAKENVTLKGLCPPRWSSRYESLATQRYRYVDVMKALTNIVLLSDKKDERDDAALKKKTEKCSLIFFVVLQTKVLANVNVVSKMLQAKDADLHRAVSLLKDIIEVRIPTGF